MRGPGWVESELLPLFVRELYGLLGHLLSAEEEGKSPRGCPVPPGHLLGPTLVPDSLGGVSWGTGVGAGVCRCLGLGDTSDADLGFRLQRSCSNCGNSFCSRCCSFKVPKSSMGATGECAGRLEVRVGGGLAGSHFLRRSSSWERSEGSVRGHRGHGILNWPVVTSSQSSFNKQKNRNI